MRAWQVVSTAIFVMILALVSAAPTASRQKSPDPWVEPQNSGAAITDPDTYAWQLFVALNWPADLTKKEADPQKKFGDEGPVVWETWKNARDVFLAKGADPGAWLDGKTAGVRSLGTFDREPLQQLILKQLSGSSSSPLKFDPLAAARSINETRLNRETFEFVRSNDLYNIEGQIAFFRSSAQTISFPVTAKEIKAQWREIKPTDKPRYHWVEAKAADGSTKLYGLTALHITTKDLPNWFWATFEHIDNPKLQGNEAWLLESRDSFACKGKPTNCNLAPTGIGLEGTKWANYRLRGTQVDFSDVTGRPILLANSQPEAGFQESSSCMTCHARASIGLIAGKPERLSIFKRDGSSPTGAVEGYVGPIAEDWYSTDTNGAQRVHLYKPLDFVWSLFRAQPKGAS